MWRNVVYGGSYFKLRIRTRNGRIVVGWCTVINENHMFIWVESYPCLPQKIISSLSSHSTKKFRVEDEFIDGWHCQCYSSISLSLTTYMSICPRCHPCSSVTSCCPNIVSSLVFKCTLIHYSMAHEPVGMHTSKHKSRNKDKSAKSKKKRRERKNARK